VVGKRTQQAVSEPGDTGARSAVPAPGRRLRILFVVQRGTLLRFALLIPALAERGHRVHIAFAPGRDWEAKPGVADPPPPRALSLANDLVSRYPDLTHGLAPRVDTTEGWRQVAWMVRGLADLAHSAHPRYTGADTLRHRAKRRILRRLRRDDFEPIARRLALRMGLRLSASTNADLSASVLRRAALLEDAIPTSPEIDHYIERLAPDVLIATGPFRHVSSEVELLKSARRLGIPSGVFVASWDNLTNKGSLKFTPERVFVWNEIQVKDAVEMHRIPRDRLVVTGAHVFDNWFERRPSRTREEFMSEVGLDATTRYLLYLCSSRAVTLRGEVDFVRTWIGALRASDDERIRRMNVVVRPHPNAVRAWDDVDLGFENAVVWPANTTHPVASQARADFFDTLYYSSAVVGINTTAMIEATILGKSVLTVLVPEFRQETTLHFHYLVAENGGFALVGENLEQHLEQLGRVLDEDEADAERRRQFVESFVRPAGLDRPAAMVAASAIEELADLPVESAIRPSTRLLRLALSLEVGLNTAYSSYRGLRGRKKRRGMRLKPAPREPPG
jgi:hypothetical protein